MSTIVFDLDGTLVDSAPDLHAAANRMLAEQGHAPLSLAQVQSFIGHGIPNLVAKVMQARAIPETRSEAMTASMLRHYTAHPADLTRPYPHVPETLARLAEAGLTLGVCTNKNAAPARQILDALNLSRFFAVVIGGDDAPRRKPDPMPLQMAFDALDAPPLLFIGDSEVDAETARRAALPFGLYTKGYRKTAVDALPHAFAFDDWAGLPDLIPNR